MGKVSKWLSTLNTKSFPGSFSCPWINEDWLTTGEARKDACLRNLLWVCFHAGSFRNCVKLRAVIAHNLTDARYKFRVVPKSDALLRKVECVAAVCEKFFARSGLFRGNLASSVLWSLLFSVCRPERRRVLQRCLCTPNTR